MTVPPLLTVRMSLSLTILTRARLPCAGVASRVHASSNPSNQALDHLLDVDAALSPPAGLVGLVGLLGPVGPVGPVGFALTPPPLLRSIRTAAPMPALRTSAATTNETTSAVRFLLGGRDPICAGGS